MITTKFACIYGFWGFFFHQNLNSIHNFNYLIALEALIDIPYEIWLGDSWEWRPYFLDLFDHDDQDDFHIAVIGLKQKLEDHPVITVSGIFCVV